MFFVGYLGDNNKVNYLNIQEDITQKFVRKFRSLKGLTVTEDESEYYFNFDKNIMLRSDDSFFFDYDEKKHLDHFILKSETVIAKDKELEMYKSSLIRKSVGVRDIQIKTFLEKKGVYFDNDNLFRQFVKERLFVWPNSFAELNIDKEIVLTFWNTYSFTEKEEGFLELITGKNGK
jgi:hypothetical protein